MFWHVKSVKELYIKLLRIFIRNGLCVRKLYKNRSPYMRQMSVISGYPIFTGFRGLTGCQQDPRDRGITNFTFKNNLKLNRRIKEFLLGIYFYFLLSMYFKRDSFKKYGHYKW